MSIVYLKSLLFGRSNTSLQADTSASPLYHLRTNPSPEPYPSPPLITTAADPESADDAESSTFLPSRKEAVSSFPRFRLDPRLISDATIGLSDGLTVPFALTAGLSALGQPRVVILGGIAELIAGAISMGLGGYLGACSEAYAPPTPSPPIHSAFRTNARSRIEKKPMLIPPRP
jgi:hypothetical protein